MTYTTRIVSPAERVGDVLADGQIYLLRDHEPPAASAAAFERRFGREPKEVLVVGVRNYMLIGPRIR